MNEGGVRRRPDLDVHRRPAGVTRMCNCLRHADHIETEDAWETWIDRSTVTLRELRVMRRQRGIWGDTGRTDVKELEDMTMAQLDAYIEYLNGYDARQAIGVDGSICWTAGIGEHA